MPEMTEINGTSTCCANFSESSTCSKLLLTLGIILAIVGILAATQTPGFNSMSSYWYVFEIGAAICFVISCCSCCRTNAQNPVEQQAPPPAPKNSSQHPVETQTPTSAPQASPPPVPKTPSQLFQEALYAEHHAKQPNNAAQLYYAAAQQGHREAWFHVGRCYENGIGAVKNMDHALECYTHAANAGHIESIYTLAVKAFENGKEKEGFAWAKKGAKLEAAQGNDVLQDLFNRFEQRPQNTPASETDLLKDLIISDIRLNLSRITASREVRYALAPQTVV